MITRGHAKRFNGLCQGERAADARRKRVLGLGFVFFRRRNLFEVVGVVDGGLACGQRGRLAEYGDHPILVRGVRVLDAEFDQGPWNVADLRPLGDACACGSLPVADGDALLGDP